MELRRWQSECITKAHNQFINGDNHFLCLATPGAGKTFMASQLAKKLFDEGTIDLVICFSPSLIVSIDFKEELENQTNKRLDAKLGSFGCSITYQSMLNLSSDFWELFIDNKVFVIFDEIHHCSGSNIYNANAWGERIISKIQDTATFTIALSGTPWRSDKTPIVLAKYTNKNKIHCDYNYGIALSIDDNVCRTPSITLIDNEHIKINSAKGIQHYRSFNELLELSEYTYQNLVTNETLMLYMLNKANDKLNTLREKKANAGGLIVASSVAHAKAIHQLIKTQFNESADIVTYQEDNPISSIKNYRNCTRKWIISVGMISEGTNLPRLCVCCYLTRVKTELYFRQVLGRILRVEDGDNEIGFFYVPAENTLSEYSNRIADDIPDVNIINTDTITSNETEQLNNNTRYIDPYNSLGLSINNNDYESYNAQSDEKSLLECYNSTLDIFGKFKQTILQFNDSHF